MLTDSELRTLEALAKLRSLPIGTAAYEVLARALARRRK
jgi:hypothetical protein